MSDTFTTLPPPGTTYDYLPPISGVQRSGTLKRSYDSAFIPCDPANRDYSDFLRWVEAGHVEAPLGWLASTLPS